MGAPGCPTPGKKRYKTHKAARLATWGTSRSVGHGLRAYRCACGGWHVTKKLPVPVTRQAAKNPPTTTTMDIVVACTVAHLGSGQPLSWARPT